MLAIRRLHNVELCKLFRFHKHLLAKHLHHFEGDTPQLLASLCWSCLPVEPVMNWHEPLVSSSIKQADATYSRTKKDQPDRAAERIPQSFKHKLHTTCSNATPKWPIIYNSHEFRQCELQCSEICALPNWNEKRPHSMSSCIGQDWAFRFLFEPEQWAGGSSSTDVLRPS